MGHADSLCGKYFKRWQRVGATDRDWGGASGADDDRFSGRPWAISSGDADGNESPVSLVGLRARRLPSGSLMGGEWQWAVGGSSPCASFLDRIGVRWESSRRGAHTEGLTFDPSVALEVHRFYDGRSDDRTRDRLGEFAFGVAGFHQPMGSRLARGVVIIPCFHPRRQSGCHHGSTREASGACWPSSWSRVRRPPRWRLVCD